MSDIITSEEFDRIFDRIIFPDKLRTDMFYMTEAMRNYYVEKFLKKNCYSVYYENEKYYVMIDAEYNEV